MADTLIDHREYLKSMKPEQKSNNNAGDMLESVSQWVNTAEGRIAQTQDEISSAKKLLLSEIRKINTAVGENKSLIKEMQESYREGDIEVEAKVSKVKKDLSEVDNAIRDDIVSLETSLTGKIERIDKRKADEDSVTKSLTGISEKMSGLEEVLTKNTSAIGSHEEMIIGKVGKEIISDDVVSSDTTYSSEKIEKVIASKTRAQISYGGGTSKIDDTVTTDNRTWSSTKIQQQIDSSAPSGTWGSIIGTLSNQTDLQAALDANIVGATHTHTQSTPSTTRTMTHNLGYNPNYIAVDNIGRQFFAAPSRPDTNTMVLTLSAATSGVAYLS